MSDSESLAEATSYSDMLDPGAVSDTEDERTTNQETETESSGFKAFISSVYLIICLVMSLVYMKREIINGFSMTYNFGVRMVCHYEIVQIRQGKPLESNPSIVVEIPAGIPVLKFDEFPGEKSVLRVATPFKMTNQSIVVDWQNSDMKAFTEYYDTQYLEWIHIKNVQTLHFGGIYLDGKAYYLNHHEQKCQILSTYKVYQVQNVFNLLHRWRYFGHYLIDYVPLLTMMTRKMRQEGYFLMRQLTKFNYNALSLFGVPPYHIIELKYEEEILAKNMYMVRPLQMQTMHGIGLQKMRKFFVEKLGLDKEKPYRYVFYNKKNKRRMKNLYQLQGDIEFTFRDSGAKFELFQDEPKPAPEQFKWAANSYYFNEMMWGLACHSSGYLNLLFMQSNTVFVVIETKQSDGRLFLAIAHLFHRHGYFIRDGTFPHGCVRHGIPVETIFPLAEMAVRKALEVSQNWKQIPDDPQINVPLLDVGFTLKTV